MRKDAAKRVPRRCECPDCLRHPNGPTAREHRSINRVLAKADELSRRLFVGLLAQQHGRGGVALLHRVTGLDRNTIARGLRELQHHQPGSKSQGERFAYRLAAAVLRRPWLYRLALRLARLVFPGKDGWLHRLPGPAEPATHAEELKAPARHVPDRGTRPPPSA